MKTIECVCPKCGNMFNKPLNEWKRRNQLNRILYCSRKCSAIGNSRHFGDKRNITPPVRIPDPFNYYIRNSRKRDKVFDIDTNYLREVWESQKGICPYSGVQLVLSSNSKRAKDITFTASLDRIDSSKGYIVGNVQFISTAMNYMKSTLSHDQTIAICKTISLKWCNS